MPLALNRLITTAAFLVLLTSALVASGCGSSSSSNGRTVQIDGHSKAYNATFTAYFPKRVTVHPGDTVSFHENWSGEPHSVTTGTLVEKGLSAAAHSNPNGPPPHAFAILPTMLPQGPGDAIQAAARPCYLQTGAPPQDPKKPCVQVAQPAFNGTQTYYSSGYIKPGETWKMRLASNIKPGTYHYYCNLHGAMMSGSIVVVPKSQPVPSQSQDDATGRAEFAKLVNAAEPAFRAAQAGHYPIHGNLAGVVSQSVQNVGINEFVAKTIHAKVGQPVSWTFLGAHTVTLGGPENDEPILETAKDGSVHLRQSSVAPAGGPGAPPSTGSPSSSRITTKVVHGGSYHGGLHSTGLVLSFPPQLTAYTLTFSKPGTYTFDCLVHPHMDGKVVVAP